MLSVLQVLLLLAPIALFAAANFKSVQAGDDRFKTSFIRIIPGLKVKLLVMSRTNTVLRDLNWNIYVHYTGVRHPQPQIKLGWI